MLHMRSPSLAVVAAVAAVSGLLPACGGTTRGSGASALPLADAGSSGGASASAGGSAGSSHTEAGGASSPGAGGMPGAGGASPSAGGAPSGGSGTGGGPIDCSNVGCGPPPVCGEPCGTPCGCCPCAAGERNGPYVCEGGCYAPVVADGGKTCDPAAETHRRSYVGASPPDCSVIKFSCQTNTTYFANACGCGCEQSASCPEWFDCMPSPQTPPCDPAQIQADCPYSGIAY